jgi:hypothetical protein
MMTPDHLVNDTIRTLENLAVRFAHEVRTEGPLTPEQRLRKEALMTTRVLLSKLRLVRSYGQEQT